jgi:3-keto-5-aminohexanoate cleavage enzyme
MIHLHARTESGETTTDPEAYRGLCAAIRSAGCDAILNISAGDDGGRASHAQRLAVLDGGAEVVSLDAGSFNLGDRLYDNHPEYLRALARGMQSRGIKPEIEVFDTGHLSRMELLAAEGLITPTFIVQFVTGPVGTLPPDLRLLSLLVDRLPQDAAWCVSAQTGDDHALHARLLLWAFTHGGHVRTGFEDTAWLRAGVRARSNAELVEQWSTTAHTWGRPIATPTQARAMLAIPEPSPGTAAVTSDVEGT